MKMPSSTTFNPVFFEEEISDEYLHFRKAIDEAKELWESLKLQKEQGQMPREDVLECARLTITGLNRKKNYQMTIEANISVLNGMSIEAAEEKYYEEKLDDARNEDEKVQERYKELLGE